MTKRPAEKTSRVVEALKDINYPESFLDRMETLFAQMQGPEARTAVLRALNSSPEELGAAAVKAARAERKK